MADWREAMRAGIKAMEKTMAEDIVERLRLMLPKPGTGNGDINAVFVATISDAIAEIERLRADVVITRQMSGFKEVAGAVSEGQSFSDLKQSLRG